MLFKISYLLQLDFSFQFHQLLIITSQSVQCHVSPQTKRTVYKSVQVWMAETEFGAERGRTRDPGAEQRGSAHSLATPYAGPHNYTVLQPRALNIARRIERAIALNVTAQYASQPLQVELLC